MGSSPSVHKTVDGVDGLPVTSQQLDNPTEQENENEVSDDNGAEGSATKLTNEEILDKLKVKLDELNSLDAPWENDGKVILDSILKRYNKCKRKPLLISVGDLLIESHFLDVCVRIWDFCHTTEDDKLKYISNKAYFDMKVVLWNYSNKCENIAKCAFKQEMFVERCMRELSLSELDVIGLEDNHKRYLFKATLGFLLNIVRLHNPNYTLIRKEDGVQKLLAYYKSKYLIIKSKVMILLAYCINEEENEKIMTDTGVINFIKILLESALNTPSHIAETYAFSATESVMGLDKLAFNDDNKKSIVHSGILPLITKMLAEDGSAEEHEAASHFLWTLSFHPDNKDKIKEEPKLLEAVHRISNNPDAGSATLRSCDGILFVIEGIETNRQPHDSNMQGKHIMISYQWNVQETILHVRDRLKENGYKIWIDVDRVEGSILSAMADGIENSLLVIVAMTEQYKNSNPCRTEAEYAYKLSKPFIPLLLQPDYKPDGWLGALLGMQLYIDISEPDSVNEKYGNLLQLVRSKINTVTTISETVVDAPLHASPPSRAISKSKNATDKISCSAWTTDEVNDWLSNCAIDGVGKALAGFDGVALAQLVKLMWRSPDVYYNALQNDLKMQWIEILHFTEAIERL